MRDVRPSLATSAAEGQLLTRTPLLHLKAIDLATKVTVTGPTSTAGATSVLKVRKRRVCPGADSIEALIPTQPSSSLRPACSTPRPPQGGVPRPCRTGARSLSAARRSQAQVQGGWLWHRPNRPNPSDR